MLTAKAIETAYKGYRFRSRLEARYAVFFDHLKIEWEYEKEGYHLPSGSYLPDFWLPRVQMWAEVKPVPFSGEERAKAKELVEATGYPCFELVGVPDCTGYQAWTFLENYQDMPFEEDWPEETKKRFPEGGGFGFIPGLHGDDCRTLTTTEIALLPYALSRAKNFCGHDYYEEENRFYIWPEWDKEDWPVRCPDMVAASHAARSARFEHGQKGAFRRG